MKRKSRSSTDMIRIVMADGWYLHEITGDHHQFKHPTKKGRTTVPHRRKDLTIREQRSILKQAQIQLDEED